jgi:hypothetical protein
MQFMRDKMRWHVEYKNELFSIPFALKVFVKNFTNLSDIVATLELEQAVLNTSTESPCVHG